MSGVSACGATVKKKTSECLSGRLRKSAGPGRIAGPRDVKDTRGCRVTRTTSDTRYWKWAPRSSTGRYFEVGDHIKERPISHVSDVLRHYQAHLSEQSSLSSPLSVSGLQGLFLFFFVTFITWLISCISEIVWANALIRRVSVWICPGTIKCPLFTVLKMTSCRRVNENSWWTDWPFVQTAWK